MATLFKPVIDVKHRPYCGPAAIAVLTGVPVARIEKMIRRCRKGYARETAGRRVAVRGTSTGEVITVLERLGCKVERFSGFVPKCPVRHLAEDTSFTNQPYLVEVTGHWMALHNGVLADNSNPLGVPVADYKRGTRRVLAAWAVSAPTTPVYTQADPIAVAPRPAKPKPDIKAVRMARLAAQIATWEAKERRAKTALLKLRPKLRRYQRLGIGG